MRPTRHLTHTSMAHLPHTSMAHLTHTPITHLTHNPMAHLSQGPTYLVALLTQVPREVVTATTSLLNFTLHAGLVAILTLSTSIMALLTQAIPPRQAASPRQSLSPQKGRKLAARALMQLQDQAPHCETRCRVNKGGERGGAPGHGDEEASPLPNALRLPQHVPWSAGSSLPCPICLRLTQDR